MPVFQDLTGRRFGQLSVLERAKNGNDNQTRFLCVCDCGKQKIIRAKHLKSGAIKDCGCGKSRKTSIRNTTHGESRARLYNIWIKMRDRCTNPRSKDWHDYGGRGITVCESWYKSYTAFREWALSYGYDDRKSIDRVDVNKGYTPDNCRWADNKCQANNKRTNHRLTYKGRTITLAEASEISGIPYGTLKRRIANGWTVVRAMETPIRVRKTKQENDKGYATVKQ